jgi:hypothetical protein
MARRSDLRPSSTIGVSGFSKAIGVTMPASWRARLLAFHCCQGVMLVR